MAVCKSPRCQAEIIWGRNVDSGKGVPLNPEPSSDGALLLVRRDVDTGELLVRGIKKGERLPFDAVRYDTHFATCEDASRFAR